MRPQGGSPPAPRLPGSSAVPPSCELPFLFNPRQAAVRRRASRCLERRAGLLEEGPLRGGRWPTEHRVAVGEAAPLRDDVAVPLGVVQRPAHVLAQASFGSIAKRAEQ